MLFLTQKDIHAIANFDGVLSAVETDFSRYSRDDYFMPLRFSLENQNRTLLYMPCFVDKVYGAKMLSLFPENRKKNIPTISGIMSLCNNGTGETLCLLDAACMTAWRTGAVGAGVGCRYLSRADVQSVALIGCGTQGLYQLAFCLHERPIKKAYLYDRYKRDLSGFISRFQSLFPQLFCEMVPCETADEALLNADIVITATTSNEPVFSEDRSLDFEGKLMIGVGSYKSDMREYPDRLFDANPVVVTDCEHALEETGDILSPVEKGLVSNEDIYFMSDIVMQKPLLKSRTFFYKSVGMALFDVLVSDYLYHEAKKQGFGTEIEL